MRGLWFVCGCEGLVVLWGLFLVCEGVRVFCVLVFVWVVFLVVCLSACPLCGLCGSLFLSVFFGFGFVVFSCVVSCVLMDFRLPS